MNLETVQGLLLNSNAIKWSKKKEIFMGSIYTLNQALDKVQELYDKRYTLEEAIKIVKKRLRGKRPNYSK